jgi:hypothetical protein
MATATKRQEDAPPTVQPGSIDELVHVVVLFLKYQGIPQGVLVHDLSKVGLTPARIASLILTTPNTVSQRKREKRPEWPPKVKAGRNGSD